MIMSTIRKRWNRLVLDIVMARPPPVVAAVCFVFGSVFFIGYFCAHWVDQVDLAAYRPYSIFADNILEQPLLGKLSSVLPVDVVYTWVNGSDPLFLNGLHKLKEEQKAQGEICSLTHCMAASYIAIRSTSNEPEELEDLQSIPSVLHQSKQKVLYRAGERRYTLLQIASGINPSFILERIRYMVPETSYMHQAFWTTDVDSAWGVKWPRAVIISGVTELGPIEIMRMVLPDDQESCNAYGEGDLMVIECETEAPLKARFDAGITKWELKGQTIRMHAATLVLELDTSQHEEEMDPKRFDDNEELRYSLRSLEKFAPWVRRVFIVTNGQIPYWLNLEHPRLTLVTHEEIFTNLSHLPSFSSPAIEVHLHRIPGLSEHFLYLNDDVMFGAEVWPEDFYSPSAGYKVYLAWSLPECASGCPGSWLGDGYCDTSCNTSNCQWDGGDCADNSIESNPDHNFLDFDDNNLFNKDSFCSPSCSDSWLADKFCDYECNIEKCGFDGGDCGLSSFSQLYQLNVPQEGNTSYHIPKGTSVCWMNISSLIEDSLVEGEYSDHQLIRSLSINTAQGILVVMVKPNITLQLSVVLGMESKDKSRKYKLIINFDTHQVEKISNVTNMDLVGENFTFAQVNPKVIKEEGVPQRPESTEEYHHVNFYLSGMPSDVLEKARDLESQFLAKILTLKGFKRKRSELVQKVLKNEPQKKLVFYDNESWIPVRTNGSEHIGNISLLHSRNLLEVKLEKSKLEDYSYGNYISDYSMEGSDSLKKQEDLQSLSKEDYAVPHYGQRRLLDMFGESLLHVNRLYNLEFGYQARRVPAHMPHMINRKIMTTLQKKFHHQFEMTSSHKIRHGNDMQFSFSYFYFLMSTKLIRTYEAIFDLYDTDESGTWSDREIRTFLAQAYDLPLHFDYVQRLHTAIRNCSTFQDFPPVPTPLYERYVDSNLPTVSKELVLACPYIISLMKKQESVPLYQHFLASDAVVHFKMISSNISTVIQQLDDVRKNPKKFVCLNNNMDSKRKDNELIHALVQDTYESLFPLPSAFELPPMYRNRFLYASELESWKQWRNFVRALVYASVASLILLTLINFFSTEIEGLRRRWCRRKRRKDRFAHPHV
ncbi:N-acetylglucosamine-1-phosphotransferase subunits alpha/beta-like [Oratosquilla oratoria]|uniref:N-acetylglucosamine-1-phosphotransferase subunits alpha/beta-like n=1 Tax=Oratosquilla oratoria TaxID=337810 RepID=UPI003F75731C